MANTTSSSELSSILQGKKLFTFVFLAVLIFFNILGNVIVCLAICKTAKLRTSSNMLIVNMALGDMLYSASTLPLSMVFLCYRDNWPLGIAGNIAFDAGWFMFLVLSFLNVAIIASERYLAVTKPFTYKTIATRRRVFYGCICVWSYVILLIVGITFSFRDSNGTDYIFLVPGFLYYALLIFHTALVFISVPTLYARIFLIARKHKLEILRQKNAQIRRSFYREMKATWTVGLVITLFFLVWLPFLVYQFVDLNDIYQGLWDTTNSKVCYVTYCNGPVNILVYSWWNREIRKAILRLLMPWKRARISPSRSNVHSTTS